MGAYPGGRAGRFAACADLCMIGGLTMPNVLDDLPACVGCASCCHLVVELMPGIDHVPEEFVVEHDGVRCMEQRGDGACVALDPLTRACTIYERRPKACRDFERGAASCRKAVAGLFAAALGVRGPAS